MNNWHPQPLSSRLEHIGEILARLLEAIATGELPAYSDFHFDSPCDSPIENIFVDNCLKHLRSDISGVDRQVEVDTQHGQFRIDFVLTVGEKKIAVECDGRDFHDAFRDEFRDAILLGEGHFDTIYHFRGCDLTYYPDDCIWLMSKSNPELFSQRGHLYLKRLHRLEINEDYLSESFSAIDRISPGFYQFRAFRRTTHSFWKVLYDFACKHHGASIDELVSSWMRIEIEV